MVAIVSIVAAWPGGARAADCTVTSVGFTPLDDLGAGLYLGQFQGGLYSGGQNVPPPAHAAEGLARALGIAPLDAAGNPDPNGKYVLLSIGMSNTTQEFCSQNSALPCDPWTFMGQAVIHPQVNHTTLAIVNGARGGQAADAWEFPDSPNYNRIRDTRLAPLGLTEAQVQVAWVKVADRIPTVSLPAPGADAFVLLTRMGNIARAMHIRYPNLAMILLSSRIYAGYATSTLSPEPYAYESGFAVKWLIEAQVTQMAGGSQGPLAGDLDYQTAAPWLGWGPYLWADGLVPRTDGLIWACSDLETDGTHPSMSGEEKVGSLLLDFMLNSPLARPWFRACFGGDPNADGTLDTTDIAPFTAVLLGTPPPGILPANSDMNCDGRVDGGDIQPLVQLMTAGP